MMMMMINIIFSCRPISLAVLCREIIGPFLRENMRRVLDANCTIYTSMSYLIRRVLAKPRLILDEMCHLYGKFASYVRRVLFFPRINGPN